MTLGGKRVGNFLQQTSKSPRGGCPCPCFLPGSLAGGGSAFPPAEGTGSRTELRALASSTDSKHPPCPAAFHRSSLALLLLPMTRTLKWSFWKPAKGHRPGNCRLYSGKLSREKASRRTRGFVKQLLILNCLLWKTWLWGLKTLQSLFCDWCTNYSLLLTFPAERASQVLVDHRVLYQCDNAQEGNKTEAVLSASVNCIEVLALIVT